MNSPLEDLGVLITSHPRQQMFFDQGIASWKDYPYHILLGYDDENLNDVPLEKYTPPVKDTFVTGSPAGQLGHFRGELIQLQMGAKILAEQGKKYIYKTAADTGIFRWRNLENMMKLLSKNDMIICGTTQIFAKLDVFNKVMEAWHLKMKCGGAELYLYSQIRRYDVKVQYEKPPFWEKILGFVHIQGEYAINTKITVLDTWKLGQLWGERKKHRDIVPGRGVLDLEGKKRIA